MSPVHARALAALPHAGFRAPAAVSTLDAAGRALHRRLAADKWPWIGVRCLTLTLADGSRYTPTLVSVDEGVVCCWEPASPSRPLGHSWLAQIAHLLPVARGVALYFTVAHRLGAGWVDHDVAPLSDIPAELRAARPTFERLQGRTGAPCGAWAFRDWAIDAVAALRARCLRAKAAA